MSTIRLKGSPNEGDTWQTLHYISLSTWKMTFKEPNLTHSQLLKGLKSESKYKTSEGGGVGARSLDHNTLRGRGACWSSGMGLGRVDKLHSLTRACTQPTQGD